MCSRVIPIIINNVNSKAVDLACDFLTRRGIIAVPTDTVYGLMCLAQDPSLIERLYKIKGRHKQKPIAICLDSVQSIPKWSKVTVISQVLTTLLPGPYTLLFERNEKISPKLNPESNLIGIRIPNHSFIQKICKKVATPLALTSANISSESNCNRIEQFSHLWPSLDAVFDGGKISSSDPNSLGSTVIDLSTAGYYKITRPGCALQSAKAILEKEFSLKPLPQTIS